MRFDYCPLKHSNILTSDIFKRNIICISQIKESFGNDGFKWNIILLMRLEESVDISS